MFIVYILARLHVIAVFVRIFSLYLM